MLEKLFQLSAHKTTVRTEIIAGITTFAAMSYILAVNPGIMAAARASTKTDLRTDLRHMYTNLKQPSPGHSEKFFA